MKLSIVILEDEPEVRAALERDLMTLAPTVRIEPAEDVSDAETVIEEIQDDDDAFALILCDHRLPGTTGIDFMIELAKKEATADTRKVLITGQADLQDTIRAVNDAHIDHFIAKPWNADDLLHTVRNELTEYVIAKKINPLRYLQVLNQVRALDAFQEFAESD
ncbi:response regulator [Actinomycetaceae bacterium MB13-C1-2]|nr:response regulator [Actinomycetaceae bacterium MB13-C1-2]